MQPQRTIRAAGLLGLKRFLLPAGLALSLVFGLLTSAVVGIGITAERAAASTVDDEQAFVHLINNLRASKGVTPLVVDGELTTEARTWTAEMAAADKLSHSPNMANGISAQWTVLGENVGVHGIHDLEDLFDAFVNSQAHYNNLVDARFTHVGVGVVHSGSGKLWTTHRFMAAPVSAPAAAPAPTPTSTPTRPPASEPPASTPQTTQPPTTKAPATSEPKTSTPKTSEPKTSAPNPSVTKPPTTLAPVTPKPPVTAAPTTTPNTAHPTTKGTTQTPKPQTEVTPGGTDGTEASADGGQGFEAQRVGGVGSVPSDGPDADRGEMTDLVQPDLETIEDVLIELVLAGI